MSYKFKHKKLNDKRILNARNVAVNATAAAASINNASQKETQSHNNSNNNNNYFSRCHQLLTQSSTLSSPPTKGRRRRVCHSFSCDTNLKLLAQLQTTKHCNLLNNRQKRLKHYEAAYWCLSKVSTLLLCLTFVCCFVEVAYLLPITTTSNKNNNNNIGNNSSITHQTLKATNNEQQQGGPRLASLKLMTPINFNNSTNYKFNTNNSVTGSSSSSSSSSGSGNRSAKLLRETDALNYLQRFGYMNESITSGGNLIAEETFHDAVMSFQRFAGIPETGQVDSLTVEFMQMPRCGNKDKTLGRAGSETGKRKRRKKKKKRRKKRYALQGSKWRRQELTYRISQYPTKFLHKKHEVDSQIEKAFKIWSQVAPIDFIVKREGRVHIDIRFTSGEHGDGDPFDGPGNTLAHAYFPQYGGDAHFDDQEYWTIDSYAGTNIFQVAAHELGHSLGLGHSSIREALMAPFYQKYKPNFKLHPDDVLGIQALYGEGSLSSPTTTTTTTSTTTSTTTTSNSADGLPTDNGGGSFFSGFGGGSSSANKPVDLCQDSRIDAITRTEDGSTYVFRGNYYWLVTNEGLAANYPQKISRGWDGLPGNLDAALTWSDGKTFFFKGDKYWRFYNKRREPGYPKLISAGFAGIPNNVDAAFVWSGNGKTYFFKNDKYWRFDSKQEPPVGSQYPKAVSNWDGLPQQGVDAAFKWENGMTYFFAGDQYYRFDDREFAVDNAAKPQFPRSTAEWWFGCTNSNLPIRKAPTTNTDEDGELSSASSLIRKKLDTSSTVVESVPQQTTSRSFFETLSALLPGRSSLAAAVAGVQKDESSNGSGGEWSIHRGIGEEAFKRTQTLTNDNKDEQTSHASRGSQSSWLLPISSIINNDNNNNKDNISIRT